MIQKKVLETPFRPKMTHYTLYKSIDKGGKEASTTKLEKDDSGLKDVSFSLIMMTSERPRTKEEKEQDKAIWERIYHVNPDLKLNTS